MAQSGTNIGIGITSPTHKLDINGNVNIANGQPLRWGAGNVEIVNSTYDLLFKTYNGSSSIDEAMRIGSTGQVKLNNYTTSTSFPGTAVANLAVDSSGNIITAVAAGGLPTKGHDTGSGDATTTAYPLSVEVIDVNYVDVFINGVYQAKSSYTVTGSPTTTLTFATAPPNNSVIEFVTTT